MTQADPSSWRDALAGMVSSPVMGALDGDVRIYAANAGANLRN
jgi:hypothetical protein